MAWNSFKLMFLCLVISLSFATQDADAGYITDSCEGDKTTANSTYQTSLRILLSSLSSNATAKTFYIDTVVGRNSSDTVYGLFMCRGDVSSPLCRQCVVNATERLSSDSSACSVSKQGVIWYDECMVRYSHISLFSTVDTVPSMYTWYNGSISSNSTSIMSLLATTMNQTAEAAANSGNRYSTKEANISESQTLYCLAQCTQDLSPQRCTTCLTEAIMGLPNVTEGMQGERVLFPSCNVRYDFYPFYNITDEAPEGLVPETKYPDKDSE